MRHFTNGNPLFYKMTPAIFNLTLLDSSQHASTCATSPFAAFSNAMPSSPLEPIMSRASHVSTSALARHHGDIKSPVSGHAINASRARVRTYTAHALVLFNVYGVLFSSGIWLEYYSNSLLPTTSLLALSIIFAAQFVCLALAVGMSACMHIRSPRYWRCMMLTAALLVCGAYVGLLNNTHNKVWVLVLCQGGLPGLGLGILCAASVRVVSACYKHNFALASRVCVATGFAGAGTYTVVVWCCLRADRVRLGYGVALLLLGGTLLPALLLVEHPASNDEKQPKPWFAETQQPRRSNACRTSTTLAALILIATGSALPLLYLPLLLAHRPGPYRADAGVYTLSALYSTALLSSAFVPRIPPSRVSVRRLCGGASLLMGTTAILPLIWTLRLEVSVPCAVVHGFGLGTVCTLWVKMVVECGDGVAMGQASVFVLAIALCVAGAVVAGAAVLQGYEKGVGVVLGAVAACSGFGGLALGSEDEMRHRTRQ